MCVYGYVCSLSPNMNLICWSGLLLWHVFRYQFAVTLTLILLLWVSRRRSPWHAFLLMYIIGLFCQANLIMAAEAKAWQYDIEFIAASAFPIYLTGFVLEDMGPQLWQRPYYIFRWGGIFNSRSTSRGMCAFILCFCSRRLHTTSQRHWWIS